MERNLLKGVLKAWLNTGMLSGVTPEKFAETFMPAIMKYIGNCPVKLLSLLEVMNEAVEELVAEAEGNAVPNVPQTDGIGLEINPNYQGISAVRDGSGRVVGETPSFTPPEATKPGRVDQEYYLTPLTSRHNNWD